LDEQAQFTMEKEMRHCVSKLETHTLERSKGESKNRCDLKFFHMEDKEMISNYIARARDLRDVHH